MEVKQRKVIGDLMDCAQCWLLALTYSLPYPLGEWGRRGASAQWTGAPEGHPALPASGGQGAVSTEVPEACHCEEQALLWAEGSVQPNSWGETSSLNHSMKGGLVRSPQNLCEWSLSLSLKVECLPIYFWYWRSISPVTLLISPSFRMWRFLKKTKFQS